MNHGARAEETIAAVQRDLDAWRNAPCTECGKRLCGHQALFCRLLGRGDRLLCWPCLARAEGQEPPGLRDHLVEHLRRRDCYWAGWRRSNREEGLAEDALPSCVYPDGAPAAAPSPDLLAPPAAAEARPTAAAAWDAGALGCGDLVLELRMRLKQLDPGAILHVRATDPGAAEDLPAWCRLTGNPLAAAIPPDYWIRRKES